MAGSSIGAMFDRIAGSYDPLNRLFSLASDERWRRILVQVAGGGRDDRVLDVCTGTADLALAFHRAGRRVIGVILVIYGANQLSVLGFLPIMLSLQPAWLFALGISLAFFSRKQS
jgi:ubiquinone/menaquinone biosynthesis C-methylase UbiE